MKNTVTHRVGKFPQLVRKVYSLKEGLKSENVTVVCFDREGKLYAGTDKGLFVLSDDEFVQVDIGVRNPVINSLYFDDEGVMYVGAGNQLLVFNGKKKIYSERYSSAVRDIKKDSSVLWILTETVLYRKIDGEKAYSLKIGVPGKGKCITLFKNGRIYLATSDNGIHALVGKRWHWSELTSDCSGLISNNVNCLYTDPAGDLWVGTDKGICIYDDNNCWLSSENVSQLTSLNVTGIAISPNGDRWISTTTGLICQHNGILSYYGYKRWVPDPCVKSVAVSGEGIVCAATPKGVSVIKSEYITLEEKAHRLRELTETYNVRKDGYVLDRALDHEGVVSLDEGYIPNTDNDGHRTGVYVADLCFEYACTHNEDIRRKAKRSLLAMIKLTKVSGIKGFTARAIRYPDERDYGTGARQEWHITKDSEGNELEWLGETSSDEMVGHFYCYANYYDLVADEKEKELISSVVSEILDHILDNNYRLIDADSLPTTWANWDPELLNNDNKWINEKGTNSLQILTFLQVGFHITGNKRYLDEFNKLISEKHFAMNLMQYRIPDGHLCHIDDNHDFLMISLLMKYVEDPALRSVFAMGLTHHWQDERIERNALYNFIYGAATGERYDAENAIDELMDYPMDQITWSLYNSYNPLLRWDMSPTALGMEPQLFEPLPAHERRVITNDINRFICDSGADDVAKPGYTAGEDPSAYNVFPPTGNDKGLEFRTCSSFTWPYWYARYCGLIEEE